MASAVPLDARRWLRWSACALAALCLAAGAVLSLRGLSGLPVYYFYAQDAGLLIAAALGLLLLSHLPDERGRRWQPSGRQVAVAVGVAALFAYAGTWLVMLRYPMSRDEVLAQFAAEYLQRGNLGWPIPASLRPLAKALMPVWTDGRIAQGYWVSDYLPVNSALRALAGYMGDTWLAGPILLVVGMSAMWCSARRIWPETQEPAAVTLVLALTSTQLLVTAMTPYAMTAHFALNALWLACFLRGGRSGHTMAVAVGLLATGLHQFHFHVMFVTGFIVWAWLAGRRTTAIGYAAACIGYHIVWYDGFTDLMTAALGSAASQPAAETSWITAHVNRLRELEPLSSIARFAAWQNVLLLPLAALGLTRWFPRHDRKLPIAFAAQLSCAFAAATLVYQGFGYGYRYLSGVMPCILLLAAGGYMRLTDGGIRRLPRFLLPATAGFALTITLPVAIWQSHILLRPYADSFRTARAAPADIVLIDGRGGGFLQDIIRIDSRIQRPLLLDLAYVPDAELAQLCRQRRVMLFDHRQAHALGVMGSGIGDQPDYRERTARNRRAIARLHCDAPVPLRNGT